MKGTRAQSSDLDTVIAELNRKNRSPIQRGVAPVQVVRTGIPSLDYELGGGLVLGRQAMIAGWEGSGKSTIATSAAAEAQKMGMTIVWIDAERTFDSSWAARLGLTTDEQFWIVGADQGVAGELVFKIVRDILATVSSVMIVVDSIASVVPGDDYEDTTTIGPGARLMNRSIRVWNAVQNRTSILLLLNQLRMGMDPTPVVPFGKAQLFHCSQRVDVRRGSWIKTEDDVIGVTLRFRIGKSKVYKPFGEGEFDLVFEEPDPIERVKSLVLVAVEQGVITTQGSWYTIPGVPDKVQGLEKVVATLEGTSTAVEELRAEVYKRMPLQGGKELE